MYFDFPAHDLPARAAVIQIAAADYICPPENFASRAYLPRRLLISVQLTMKAGERPKAACIYTGGRMKNLKVGDRCSLSHVTGHTDAFEQGVAIDVCDEAANAAPSCTISCETD